MQSPKGFPHPSLHLRFELRFDGPILFKGFLPETRDEGIHFQLRDGKYNATLYLSNRPGQLDHVSDIPTDAEELQRYQDLRCSGLTLELENTEVDPEVVAALEQEKITEKTEKFGCELFEVVAGIHTRIVDYFRNMAKQSWVDPLFPELRGYPKAVLFSDHLSSPQIFMTCWRASWQDSMGQWRFLKVGKQISKGVAYLREGVSQETWEQLAGFIEQNKRAPFRDVLIANSLQHAYENNGRLAVIEAVIALESVIKQLLPTVIRNLPGVPTINEKALDKLLAKAGLRSVSEVVFRLIQNAAGLEEDDIALIIEAINARNQIVHDSQRDLEPTQARKYVNAVRRVCESFETWALKEKPHALN